MRPEGSMQSAGLHKSFASLRMTGHGDVTFATDSSAEASYESWPNTLLDLRHYSPKMKRPISSPSCFASFGSAAARKRSASAKKGFLFLLLRFQALLNQLDKHSIVAKAPFLGYTLDLLGQPRGQGHAPSNLLGSCHHTVMVHSAGPSAASWIFGTGNCCGCWDSHFASSARFADRHHVRAR